MLSRAHSAFFDSSHFFAPLYRELAETVDRMPAGELFMSIVEDIPKRTILDCQKCGDCAIQHVGFLCPESQCAKHIRNGACGGSLGGRCEVFPDRPCVWDRAYRRMARAKTSHQLCEGCVPPRMWELNQTSSWLNYHLQRDHQGPDNQIAKRCRTSGRRL